MPKSDPQKLIKKHPQLTHSENRRVLSHVQRESGDWVNHSLMIEDCEVPFKYRRKQRYQSLKGCRVNLTYYADQETVAGMQVDVMRVVRLKRC